MSKYTILLIGIATIVLVGCRDSPPQAGPSQPILGPCSRYQVAKRQDYILDANNPAQDRQQEIQKRKKCQRGISWARND